MRRNYLQDLFPYAFLIVFLIFIDKLFKAD